MQGVFVNRYDNNTWTGETIVPGMPGLILMYGLAAIISGSSIAGGPVPMTADFRPKIIY